MHQECTAEIWSTKPCQEWPSRSSKKRYRLLSWRGRHQYLHRIAWAMSHGCMVEDLTYDDVICHHCDNPRCFEPAHLFLGTRSLNMIDMNAKGRRGVVISPRRGEEHSRAKLTEEQVLAIRARYVRRVVTQSQLAAEYGVTQSLVGCIVRRVIWIHI